jgi:hypothetical protein
MEVFESKSNLRDNKLNKREIVMDHIKSIKQNKNPLDKKGDEYTILHYSIDDIDILNDLFDSFVNNNSYKGELIVESNVFYDNIGFKISKIISNNKITLLKIGNRNKPFSDRVAKDIGDALENNTNLNTLEVFLSVNELSPLSLCKFLKNPKSSLKNFSYLKLNQELFSLLAENLNKSSNLTFIKFFYEPLRVIDPCYKAEIQNEVYYNLADKIQNHSNLTNVDIIPLNDDFDQSINQKLKEDIEILLQTLKFSCELNENKSLAKIPIEKVFQKEALKKNFIM